MKREVKLVVDNIIHLKIINLPRVLSKITISIHQIMLIMGIDCYKIFLEEIKILSIKDKKSHTIL